MNYYGTHGYGMGFGWLVIILIIVALVYFVNSRKKEELSAKEILDKKYANGEIGDEEYKKKRDAIEK
ncbi:MAG: hypothetical protein RQ763_10210 [Sulfurimonas sp.]|uniref:SHOCT domain-containing protein n=1 Tax=Sulfurimonas sp. TaxID=2022749 RepID=UPI0028CC71A7|nr:hypothetical protein [Sulfurimonas sp.]MDT8339564.1 hypothetical protein [Sulfurimonas sp.]